jgi:hypothetical protein
MAAKQGGNVLFCMPNRTKCVLLVSVTASVVLLLAVRISQIAWRSGSTKGSPKGSTNGRRASDSFTQAFSGHLFQGTAFEGSSEIHTYSAR